MLNIPGFRSRFGGGPQRGTQFRPHLGPDLEDVSSGLPIVLARLMGTDLLQDATRGQRRLQEATGRTRMYQDATGGSRR
eukprot:4800142-Pyramimonas_sp.AAC.1